MISAAVINRRFEPGLSSVWDALLAWALPVAGSGDDAGQLADLADLRRCRNGDPDGFAGIIDRHQDRVAAMMWRFTRDHLEHEELVQEVFVQAWVSLAGYRERAPFAHWLARVATRTGYRFWRSRDRERERPVVPVEGLEQVLSDGSGTEPEEAGKLIFGLLAQLAPRDRLVLTLRYVEELDVAETARRTGWSATMVKVQTNRARARLKRLLERALGEEP